MKIRCALLLLLAGMGVPAAVAEQRIALVVGNSAYQVAPLRNPVNDATAVAARLRAAGFEVTLKKDVAQRELTRAISQFGQAMKPGAVALFYYAGHGLQVRGRNFLIPVDADIQSEATARSEGVDVDLVLEQLGPARLSVVILDACRNNPFEPGARNARGSGLAQIDAPKGTLVAYATAPGKVAADGEGANGVYTAELLKAMDVPGLKVEEVFKMVRVNVTRATGNQQIPWESSSLTGDFYFKPDNKPQVAQPDVLKALDDERRKREQEAQVLKDEMQKLRDEIRQLRAAPGPGPASATPPQVAKSAPEPQPDKPATVAKVAAQPATADASRPAPALGVLRKERGSLTFAKALAILMGVEDEADLRRLLESERALKRLPYHSAVAMGVGEKGTLPWGRTSQKSLASFAEEEALSFCAKYARNCRVIMVNGDLREDKFLELAADFGNHDQARARVGLMKRLPSE